MSRITTGIHIDPLRALLQSDDSEIRLHALISLALSGDTSQRLTIEAVLEKETDAVFKQIGRWCIGFLTKYGRDLSIAHADVRSFQSGDGADILSIPILPTLPYDFHKADYLTVPLDRELWQIVLYHLQRTEGYKSIALISAGRRLFKGTREQGDLNYVVYLRDQGLYEEALAWLRLLLAQEDQADRLRGKPENMYGHILYLTGRYADSLPYFQRSIENGRRDGWPERNTAESLAALGRHQEAKAYFEKAIYKVEQILADHKENRPADEFEAFYKNVADGVAGFYNDYAWYLATTAPPTREHALRARSLAVKACEITNYGNANHLDLK